MKFKKQLMVWKPKTKASAQHNLLNYIVSTVLFSFKYRSKDFYEFMMLVEMELSRIKTIMPETSSTHDLHILSYIHINCYYFPVSKYT